MVGISIKALFLGLNSALPQRQTLIDGKVCFLCSMWLTANVAKK